MILGSCGDLKHSGADKTAAHPAAPSNTHGRSSLATWHPGERVYREAGVCLHLQRDSCDASAASSSSTSGLWSGEGSAVLVQGAVFNAAQLTAQAGLPSDAPFPQVVQRLFAVHGIEIFARFNGQFAIALYSSRRRELTLVRDHFGIEPLHYASGNGAIHFASDPRLLASASHLHELDARSLHAFLLFNYIPLTRTLLPGILRVPPAHAVTWRNGELRTQRYWHLSFKSNDQYSEDELAERALHLLRDAVAIRTGPDQARAGAFLSGGLDSSAVVGLFRAQSDTALQTLCFRCRGRSFDESRYAQTMAEFCGSRHQLVEYPPEACASIRGLVNLMPEPFGDIGIELATYLLARRAAGNVDYVLTGDGGDELFAGHPVYAADAVAGAFERMPSFMQRIICGALIHLPDSEKKKSLLVKAKRFSYSVRFPAALHSNRWRVYYTSDELAQLVQPHIWRRLREQSPIAEVLALYDHADGSDLLSRSLYGDYQTVVSFYLQRMNILRHFGIQPRFPMLDYRLVELVAAVASHHKIRRGTGTKYIFKRALEGVLPETIVHRPDKLGHSVPMKNWMRSVASVQALIDRVLSDETLRRRGLFQPQAVRRMIRQHQSRRHNHSHRIWGMLVLELWMQRNVDGDAPAALPGAAVEQKSDPQHVAT